MASLNAHRLAFLDYVDKCITPQSTGDVDEDKLTLDMLSPLPDRLRISSLPYCPLKTLYELVSLIKEPETFDKEFYTNTGTIFHTAVQRYLSLGGKFLGDSVCRTHGCSRMGKVVSKTTDHVCPKCSKPREYVEFTVTFGKHTKGHTDGVYILDIKEAGSGKTYHYLIDFKTSSSKTIEAHNRTPGKGILPHSYNVSQIEAYCVMVRDELKIPIDGWMLAYFARDSPRYKKAIVIQAVGARERKRIRRTLESYDKGFGEMMTALNGRGKLSTLDPVIGCRMCEDEDHYRSEVSKYFYGGCLLGEDGTCFDTDELQDHLKEVWSMYKKLHKREKRDA